MQPCTRSAHWLLLLLLLLPALLAGCGMPLREPAGTDQAARQAVTDALAAADCQAGREALQRLAQTRPVERELAAARLEVAYACLAARQPAAVLDETAAYLQAHPQDPHRDYAYYLRALAEYSTWRDQRARPGGEDADLAAAGQQARRAVAACNQLAQRHPRSAYREQLVPYLRELREGLAEVELQLASRSLERGETQAAAERARYLVEHYPDTEAVLPGLALLARAHEQLGQPQAAAAALEQLAEQYRLRSLQAP